MSSLRHRLSNASSLFKYRDESRAARISILVVIMFLVSYLPFGFLVLLQSRVPAANFEESSQLAIFMILLANLSSPFIFAYRNKRVRRGVKRILGVDALCRDTQLHRQSSSSCRMSSSKYIHEAQTKYESRTNAKGHYYNKPKFSRFYLLKSHGFNVETKHRSVMSILIIFLYLNTFILTTTFNIMGPHLLINKV